MMFGSSICRYLLTRIILVFWRIAFHKERLNFSLLALLSPILSLFIQYNTRNLVLDTFISTYKTMAEEHGIRFLTKIQIDKDRIPTDDYQLSIIIGNLLENAYNECQQIPPDADPFIRFTVIMDDRDDLIIQTMNSKKKNPSKQSKDPLYHGYGILNIEQIVNELHGIMLLEKDNKDVFTANISIPIINPAKRLFSTLK